MAFNRLASLSLLLASLSLACSQSSESLLLPAERDASVDAAEESSALPSASPEARAVLGRLDARLGAFAAKASARRADRLDGPSSESAADTPPAIRLKREAGLLHVQTDSPSQAQPIEITLPLRAHRAFRIVDAQKGLEVHVALKGASDVEGEAVDGQVVYRQAALGRGDIVHRPSASGTEDFILFDEAPPGERLEYEMALGDRVAGLRLVENVLELLDEGGDPRLRVASPYVIDANDERHDATLSVEGCAFDRNASAPWGREPIPPGASSCTVVVDWKDRGLAYPAVVDPSWESTGAMQNARYNHAATLLDTGKVLVSGGFSSSASNELASAELYNPETATWALTGALTERRQWHAMTLLQNGKVLATGGYHWYWEAPVGNHYVYYMSAQLYDPSTGKWSSTSLQLAGRERHVAVLLEDGSVLLAGGEDLSGVLASAEVYDVDSATFTLTGSMANARTLSRAVRLPGGKVLVAGGQQGLTTLSSAELYDPITKTFTSAASMPGARANHTMTLLADGRALVAGGYDGSSFTPNAPIYDPVTNSWSETTGTVSRNTHTATLLIDGKVLVAGGYNSTSLSSAQLFDPLSNSWSSAPTMKTSRRYHTATLLRSGDVLLAGGLQSSTLSASELFTEPKTCTQESDCASGDCVDGHCCDRACDAPCERCDLPGSLGICKVAPSQSPGSPSCAPYVCNGASAACPSSCTSDPMCVSSHVCKDGVCQPRAPNGASCTAHVECQSGACDEGICCDRACSGSCESCQSGTCSFIEGTPKRSCGYYACTGTSGDCPSSCANDAHCRSEAFCDEGACKPKAVQGASCESGAQCQSGFCVDGVCCESACGGPCAQCNRHDALGTCAPVVGDPVGGRACGSDGSACGGSCDGLSLDCSYPSAGSVCAPASCVDGVAWAEPRCDGKGLCAPGESRHCAPYGCDGSDCKAACVDSSDCHGTSVCVQGHCIGTLGSGEGCVAGGECKTGHCVDGVCCDSACDEPCAACNVSGAEGTCIAHAKAGCEADGEIWDGGEPSGCGCRVAGEKREGSAGLALFGVAIGLVLLKRRRA